jgi:uncharacterized protein YkwD
MPARRSGRHQAVHSHARARPGHGRVRPVLGVVATGVVVAALAFVATTTTARFLLASGTAAGHPCPAGSSASAAACPTASPPATPGARTTGPAVPAATGSPSSEHPPPGAASLSPGRATATSGPATAAADSAVEQVLQLINKVRAQAGLPGYTITAGLTSSSGRHNALMVGGCGLSHQCKGEPSLGARETAAGVSWTSAGENIGEGGPVAGSPAAIAQMAVELTTDMLNERPPDDGHRMNILSHAYRHIGIAITRDSHGTVWMTQDFSN